MNVRRLALAALLPVLAGCGTTVDIVEHTHGGSRAGESMIYGGVQTDFHVGTAIVRQTCGSEEFRVVSIFGFFFALIDTPLSFAFDTLLLPVTLTSETSAPPPTASDH